uniref:Death associated protein n=1 Tax=Sus scrofa TaxID=9823 RepID=A0A8D1IEW7_PIG
MNQKSKRRCFLATICYSHCPLSLPELNLRTRPVFLSPAASRSKGSNDRGRDLPLASPALLRVCLSRGPGASPPVHIACVFLSCESRCSMSFPSLSSSPPKPTVFISGAIARGDKDFPPAAAQVAHQKPHASIDKHPCPRTQHIQQPRK